MARCPNCGVVSEHFVDHIEGKGLACPVCGFVRRDRNCVYYLTDTFPGAAYPALGCLEISSSVISGLVRRKFPSTITINIVPATGEVYGNVEQLAYPGNTFDFIVCLDVLEHVEHDAQAVQEMFRVLRPGGGMLVHTPVWSEDSPSASPDQIHAPEYHMDSRGTASVRVWRYYGCGSLVALLKSAGFRVKEIRFFEEDFVLHQDLFYECHKDNET